MKKPILLYVFFCVFLQNARGQEPVHHLIVELQRGVFSDTFQLLLHAKGKTEIDDRDALKIDEGYLSVSGLYQGGTKLAIEERASPDQDQSLNLFVKGYSSGLYNLRLTLAETGNAKVPIILFDQYLNKKLPLMTNAVLNYAFEIDPAIADSYGSTRFSLLLSKAELIKPVPAVEAGMLAFPNPFKQHLFINVKNNPSADVRVSIKDLLGRMVWREEFKNIQANDILELACGQLMPGLYLLEWKDLQSPEKLLTLKIIKQ